MTAINSNRAIRGPVTAVPVVAGKGVRIVPDVENNRFVVEADETVLWEGEFSATAGSYFNVSESVNNFEQVQIQFGRSLDLQNEVSQNFLPNNNVYHLTYCQENEGSSQVNLYTTRLHYDNANLKFTVNTQVVKIITTSISQNTTSPLTITKVIGINRISST